MGKRVYVVTVYDTDDTVSNVVGVYETHKSAYASMSSLYGKYRKKCDDEDCTFHESKNLMSIETAYYFINISIKCVALKE